MNRRYGAGTVEAKVEDQYYNMYEVLKDHWRSSHWRRRP